MTPAGSKLIRIEGWDEERSINNILLEEITINGRRLDLNSPLLITNEYVNNLQVR